jgi:hypothetical protein
MATTKKKTAKKPTKKAIREKDPEKPALVRKLSVADFRRKYPETAPNRFVAGPTDDPVTVVLDGGSTVTKGRGHVLTLEDAGRIGKFRLELRSE